MDVSEVHDAFSLEGQTVQGELSYGCLRSVVELFWDAKQCALVHSYGRFGSS